MKPLCTLLLALLCSSPAMAGKVIKSAVTGSPEIGRIDVISFAEQGVLLIGGGARRQIVAVETGTKTGTGGKFAEVKDFKSAIAGRLGTGPKGVEILDLAVAPTSGELFVAVRKQDDKAYLLLRVGRDGSIGHFDLKNRRHAVVPVPAGDKAPVSRITDVAWAGDRLVAAARCSEEFASKIFATEGALEHGKAGQLFSAETYHVAHGRWETKAPMSVLIPYEEDGRKYIVGAFSCTPVVKYPIDDIRPGAKIKGISMIELGSGNRPLDMFAYSKNGKDSVLSNTYRFHHKRRPFGPSPYWAVRFDEAVLADKEKVNQKAVRRLKGNEPAAEGMEMVDAYHGVVQMDRLDDRFAVALRESKSGDLDLVVLPLP